MPTIVQGNFEWDEDKNEINLSKHEIRFEEVIEIFASDFEDEIVYHELSKELRLKTIGLWRKKEVVVISTVRGGRRRIISARRAKSYEREDYRNRRTT